MADNFLWEQSASGLIFRSVERTIGAASVHNQVIEVNVGAGTEALWDGEVSLAEIDSLTGAIGSAATAAAGLLAKTLVKKTVDFTAEQTAQTIWDPTGGTKFVVVQVIVSFSAAGALTVFDGTDDTTNRIFKLNGAANGGMAWTAAIPVISAAADNILKYTTGAGVAGSLTVFGYEV